MTKDESLSFVIDYQIYIKHISDSFKAIHNRASLPDGAKVNLHVLADHNSPPMADVGDSVVVDALKNVILHSLELESH